MIAMIKESAYRRKLRMAKLRKLGVMDTVIAFQLGISKQRVGQILGPRNGRMLKPEAK